MDGKEFTVSEVIDRAGISAHTWIVFVLLAFAMIFDGYDFMIVNSHLRSLQLRSLLVSPSRL